MTLLSRLTLILVPTLAIAFPTSADPPPLDTSVAGRFADLALACVHREYPNKLSHVLEGDADARPPRELTPVFYGCYDWHSAVHGHWLLARLARLYPDAAFTARARAALDRSLLPDRIGAEVAYLCRPDRKAFERPYGLAWLLQLGTELREWDDPRAKAWSAALRPLEEAAAARLKDWLPKLSRPIRVGEHDQTAFALGLALDWSRRAGDEAMTSLLVSRIQAFYRADRGCPLSWEPSGQDRGQPRSAR